MSSISVAKHKKEERNNVPLFFFRFGSHDEEPMQNALFMPMREMR